MKCIALLPYYKGDKRVINNFSQGVDEVDFQVLVVALSPEELLNRKADFLRSIGHILSSIVEFELDSNGQPRVEEEVEEVQRTRRSLFGFSFSQDTSSTLWYFTNSSSSASRIRRATGGVTRVSSYIPSYSSSVNFLYLHVLLCWTLN